MSALRKARVRVRFDRHASVLGMMEWFAAQDIPVLPIHGVVDGCCTCGGDDCESPGKHPISSLVHNGVKGATTDLKVIRRWHRKNPGMNYAVATKGLAVIDCDSKEALRAFRSAYRPSLFLSQQAQISSKALPNIHARDMDRYVVNQSTDNR